jgi:3-dehydroquinate synthase
MLTEFGLRHPRGETRHLYGAGALEGGLAELAPALAGRALFAISSRPVLDLHGARLEAAAAPLGGFARVLEVADGERAKSVAEAERLWRELARAGGRRDSALLAFGGGSVGDLAGWVAASFLRGVEWLQVPTTLLAQVDAAVGGKTAIDLPEAKNAVGAFHHPLAVIADAGWLATLPRAELRSGLVEAVKTAALLDLALLARLEGDLDRLLAGEPEALAPVAAAAARAKAALVARDPEEAGERRLLNLGHTLGHALEAEIGYGAIAHGDAVAHGLRFALRLSVAGGGDAAFAARVERLLGRLGVPPLPPAGALDVGRLIERIGRDKKARAGGVGWVLVDGPGRGRVDVRLDAGRLRAELDAWLGASRAASL